MQSKRDFSQWLAEFSDSISSYGYYTDFDKVYRNVNSIKVELNMLNSLIGSKNIEADFENLIIKYPEVLKCVPLLLAKRENKIYCQDNNGRHLFKFDFCKKSKNHLHNEKYKYFMRKTGLFDLLENHIVNDLVDYVTGVEAGLDSHSRKNRGGKLMEDLVEGFIQKAGLTKDIDYFKEMNTNQITDKWKIDLSAISNKGKVEKRFDFVLNTPNMIYGIESNFYCNGGSKLNEIARSYKKLALESKEIKGFTFVWFTDGKGWTRAKNNLEETFDIMQHIYNIKDLENGIISQILKSR